MIDPGWTPQVAAAYDNTLNPPEEPELTEEEREDAKIAAEEDQFERMREAEWTR